MDTWLSKIHPWCSKQWSPTDDTWISDVNLFTYVYVCRRLWDNKQLHPTERHGSIFYCSTAEDEAQQSEKNNSCSAELSNSRDPPQKNPTQLHICSFNSQQPASRMRFHVSLPFLGAERGAGYELQLRLLSVQQMQEWCAELSWVFSWNRGLILYPLQPQTSSWRCENTVSPAPSPSSKYLCISMFVSVCHVHVWMCVSQYPCSPVILEDK